MKNLPLIEVLKLALDFLEENRYSEFVEKCLNEGITEDELQIIEEAIRSI